MMTTPRIKPSPPKMDAWQKPSLRRLLEQTDRFIFCGELVSSRGIIRDTRSRRVLELARNLADHPRIDALSITDNPGGNAMLGADTLGTDLIARGQEVIIHLSCKDWNRNALQSRGWELASGGFHNVLALSGDCPTSGYEGQASGVFDIDSVALLQMYCEMNRGLPLVASAGDTARKLESTEFFCGAVANNFKLHENEVMPQYFKLAKKIEAGARFIINQLGYDARKQSELIEYMKATGLDVPILGNVYVLSGAAAQFFNRGTIPGCVVTDELLQLCLQHAKSLDKGRAFFLELAAKQVAIARGLGYRGAYLGGHLRIEEYSHIIDLADSYAPDDWREFARQIQYQRPNEFFFFEQDPLTKLASDQVNRAYVVSKSPGNLRKLRQRLPLGYKFNRLVHDHVFESGSASFATAKRVFSRIDNASHKTKKTAHGVELALKVIAFECRDCGDCSLPDVAYLCPESQCAKNQRNGPCGGTREGKCEVGDKDCIWALAYDRLKAYGEEKTMLDRPTIFKDAALKGTSAWTNTFLQRDHHAKD